MHLVDFHIQFFITFSITILVVFSFMTNFFIRKSFSLNIMLLIFSCEKWLTFIHSPFKMPNLLCPWPITGFRRAFLIRSDSHYRSRFPPAVITSFLQLIGLLFFPDGSSLIDCLIVPFSGGDMVSLPSTKLNSVVIYCVLRLFVVWYLTPLLRGSLLSKILKRKEKRIRGAIVSEGTSRNLSKSQTCFSLSLVLGHHDVDLPSNCPIEFLAIYSMMGTYFDFLNEVRKYIGLPTSKHFVDGNFDNDLSLWKSRTNRKISF